MDKNKISFKKYLIYLKILKIKIEIFTPKNTIYTGTPDRFFNFKYGKT